VVLGLTMTRRDLGKFGEDTASAFLRSKGFTIVERNFRQRVGELDIVARQGDDLVFVEVRTTSSDRYGLPQESITPAKVKKLRQLAQSYLLSRSVSSEQNIRFDVVAILRVNGQVDINHIENAF